MNIEHILAGMKGVERVLVDTTDGEVKVEFDHTKISRERIAITLQQHNFNIQNNTLDECYSIMERYTYHVRKGIDSCYIHTAYMIRKILLASVNLITSSVTFLHADLEPS